MPASPAHGTLARMKPRFFLALVVAGVALPAAVARAQTGALAQNAAPAPRADTPAPKLLIERLDGKIDTDFATARRLFTLIAALHWKG